MLPLFKTFGMGITKRMLTAGVIALALAALSWFVWDHFRDIQTLKDEKVQLENDLIKTEADRDRVIGINKANQAADRLKEEVDTLSQSVVDAETAAARERAKTYKEIRDAIPQDNSAGVDPGVARTIELLWDNEDSD